MMTDNVYAEVGLNENEVNGFKNFDEPQTFLGEERDGRRRFKASELTDLLMYSF